MGYVHGKRWTEDEVKEKIMEIVNELNLDYFPTKTQMNEFYGDKSLSSKVSKLGSQYYAGLLGLKLSYCESEFGNVFEELAIDEIRENTGFLSLHTNSRYPYDLLTNGNIKVDVKASKRLKGKDSDFHIYSFNLEKREPTCDIFIFYCINENMEIDKRIIIPSCLLSGKTQLGVGGLSKWDAYIDKWEYFDAYNEFYNSIIATEVKFPKRRSKKEA